MLSKEVNSHCPQDLLRCVANRPIQWGRKRTQRGMVRRLGIQSVRIGHGARPGWGGRLAAGCLIYYFAMLTSLSPHILLSRASLPGTNRFVLMTAAVVAIVCLPTRAADDRPRSPPAPPEARTCWHADAELERQIGYCQALRDGRHLHISGVAAGGDMASAVASVYQQLQDILDRSGNHSARVLRETVFTTDLDAFKQAAAPRRKFYGDNLPAASWVQVQRLYLPEFVVEVELLAALP